MNTQETQNYVHNTESLYNSGTFCIADIKIDPAMPIPVVTTPLAP